jgi:streptogramin lyase
MNQEPPDADLERMLRAYFKQREEQTADFAQFWAALDATLDVEAHATLETSETSLVIQVTQCGMSGDTAPTSLELADDEEYAFTLEGTLEEPVDDRQGNQQPSTTTRSSRWETRKRALSPRATAIASIAAALILAVTATTIYTQFAVRRTAHPTATATASAFTKITLPEAGTRAISALAPAPDGSLWFADFAAIHAKISRLKPDGTLTEFPIPTADKVKAVYLYGLVSAPDGNLWFSGDEFDGSMYTPFLKRMTLDGAVTALPIPASPHIATLLNGPDGALWFIGSGNRSANSGSSSPYIIVIGRITMDGHITVFPPPSQDSEGLISDFCVGPDQAIWYTWTSASNDPANLKGRIGRMSLTGQVQEFSVPYPPVFIKSGQDGALWYSELAATGIVGDTAKARKGFIGRITTAGAVSEVPIDPNTSVRQFVAGSDGAVWYTMREGDMGTFGRITPGGGVKTFATPGGAQINWLVAAPGVLWIVDATNTLWRFQLPK